MEFFRVPSLLILLLFTMNSYGINKCVNMDGSVVFTDMECDGSAVQRKQIKSDSRQGHRTLQESLVIQNSPSGTTSIDRRIVYPDLDARPGLRPGEKQMLMEIKQRERRNEFYRRRDQIRDDYFNDSYSERLKKRNEEVKKRGRERRW